MIHRKLFFAFLLFAIQSLIASNTEVPDLAHTSQSLDQPSLKCTLSEEFAFASTQVQFSWGYLRIPFFALLLLILAFAIHLVWWRIQTPRSQTVALLSLFGCVLVLGLTIVPLMPSRLHLIKDLWELLLFISIFIPAALTYVSLYSIIEEESPTIVLINNLATSPDGRRPEKDVRSEMTLTNNSLLTRRLEVMRASGVIKMDSNANISLTGKGLVWARIFDAGARVIGLKKGA